MNYIKAKIQKRIQKNKTSLERIPLKINSLKLQYRAITGPKRDSRIAFHVIGGMGDHLLSAKFIQDLTCGLGDIPFDIYTKRPKLAEWIFANVPNCKNIFHTSADIKWVRRQYALYLDLIGFISIRSTNQKLLLHPHLKHMLRLHKVLRAQSHKLHNFVEKHPNLDGYLGYYTVKKGFKRHNFLHHLANIPYSGESFSVPTDVGARSRFGLLGKRYITISNGYDDTTPTTADTKITKVYPYHAQVATLIKHANPDLCIVQVGANTSEPISSADLNLINKTTLPEVADIIQHADLHIDNEGGLVHLAKALGTTSCVVFGPTLSAYFGYDGNINCEPHQCGGCWWMEGTWMTKCVKGDINPTCMYSQDPQHIANRVLAFLDNQAST
jgi:hypothetical protein